MAPYCFNSSLVRLGDSRGNIREIDAILFQFQLGAIGSSTVLLPNRLRDSVSIPAWCDWEKGYKVKRNYF